MDRRCAYCGDPIPNGMRLDARFCSALCRGRSHRRSSPETATNGHAAKREAAPRPARRPSRNGRGVRVYVLPEDSNRAILAKVEAAMQEARIGGRRG
jgi:hypothetical protein